MFNRFFGFASSNLRLLKRSRFATAGLVIYILLVGTAILADFISPYDPVRVSSSERLAPPSTSHFFGTDDMGRDVLSRVIYGSRVSVSVGLISVGIGLGLGLLAGMPMGYYRGKTDLVGMRGIDVMFAFPDILLALFVLTILGRGITNVMIALGIVYMPYFTRMVRSLFFSEREKLYIFAEKAVGADDRRIIMRHMLPNAIGPVLIQATLSVAWAIIAESALSFIGMGTPPPQPSWGRMISEARGFMAMAPWMVFLPSLVLVITVLGINLLGIGLTDVLNPRLRRR